MGIPLRNTGHRYGLVAQVMHWAVVVGIILQYTWAWRISEAESIRQRFGLVNEHKSIGMTVLALVVLRIGWRLFNRPPPLPPGTRSWERRAAQVSHALLYGLILAMPLTGWMYSSAAGYGAEFFGLVDIPDLVPVSEAVEGAARRAHEWMAWAIPAAVLVHVAAALRHHFWLRDDVLRRMLPGWTGDYRE